MMGRGGLNSLSTPSILLIGPSYFIGWPFESAVASRVYYTQLSRNKALTHICPLVFLIKDLEARWSLTHLEIQAWEFAPENVSW